MLRLICDTDKDITLDPSGGFDNSFDPDWLNNALVKELIADIDKSVVESPYCIKSPVFGQISPFMLSGGSKGLTMLACRDDMDYLLALTAFGDNCGRWLLEIGRQRDITLYLDYVLHFQPPFEIYLGNSEIPVTNLRDYYRIAWEMILADDPEKHFH